MALVVVEPLQAEELGLASIGTAPTLGRRPRQGDSLAGGSLGSGWRGWTTDPGSPETPLCKGGLDWLTGLLAQAMG